MESWRIAKSHAGKELRRGRGVQGEQAQLPAGAMEFSLLGSEEGRARR